MSADHPSFDALLPTGDGVRWEELQAFPWVRALATCPQDPLHHAEGDVAIHTRMVLEALLALPAYHALAEADRRAVYLACLLHDVAKPATTRLEAGRLTAKGHSRVGELMARRILWELGMPFALREEVCALVRYHQIPFFLIERDDAQKVAAEVSLATRAELLALVAEADIRGRVCADLPRVLDNIELFRETCRDEGCFDRPRPFASDHTRFLYFRTEGRHPDVEAYDDTEGEVVIMSGLPGSGKDTYVREHLGAWPVVSLDAVREEMDVEHGDAEGSVLQAAKEKARAHLRSKTPFVWNATNLNRQRRGPLVQLAADYGARVRIVYLEVPREQLYAQNRAREAVVPWAAILRMAERWEVPGLTEAHRVEKVVR
jgi:putative nucleotidyltransferase with HDIG domain